MHGSRSNRHPKDGILLYVLWPQWTGKWDKVVSPLGIMRSGGIILPETCRPLPPLRNNTGNSFMLSRV